MDSSEEERVATRRESSPTRRDNANSPVRGDNNEEPYGQEQQAAWGEEEDAVNDKKRRGSRSVTRTPSASPRRGDSYDRNRGDNDDDAPTSLLVRHLRFTTSPTAVRRYFEQIGEFTNYLFTHAINSPINTHVCFLLFFRQHCEKRQHFSENGCSLVQAKSRMFTSPSSTRLAAPAVSDSSSSCTPEMPRRPSEF